MSACKNCGDALVAMSEPARYDVEGDEFDPEIPEDSGPYCGPCFAETQTGREATEVE